MGAAARVCYYGTRFYSPSQGRFINRDSIEEQGGLNLYAFVCNNAVNSYDVLGRDAFMVYGAYGDGRWTDGDGPDGQAHNDSSTAGMFPGWEQMAEQSMADAMANADYLALGKAREAIKNGDLTKAGAMDALKWVATAASMGDGLISRYLDQGKAAMDAAGVHYVGASYQLVGPVNGTISSAVAEALFSGEILLPDIADANQVASGGSGTGLQSLTGKAITGEGTTTTGVNLNLYKPGDPQKVSSTKTQFSGVFYAIGSHGNENFVQLPDASLISAPDLAQGLLNYDNLNYHTGNPVLLIGCNTGAPVANGQNFAQQLANSLNAFVVAPNATSYTGRTTGAITFDSGGGFRVFSPNKP